MAPRKTKDGLLARVNFPLYSVEMLTSRHVLVAGGGGSAKTGVANGFVSIKIFPSIFFHPLLIHRQIRNTIELIRHSFSPESIGNL